MLRWSVAYILWNYKWKYTLDPFYGVYLEIKHTIMGCTLATGLGLMVCHKMWPAIKDSDYFFSITLTTNF